MIGAMTNQGGGARGRAGQRESQRDERTRVLFLVAEKSKLAFDETDCDAGD